jgi:hypothetical protein
LCYNYYRKKRGECVMEREYQVEITETLQKIVTVKAESPNDAWKMVREMYSDEEIVLTSEDYIDTDICVLEEVANIEEPTVENEDEIVDAE